MNEQELIQLCRQGNREAQRELYDQTSKRIYGLLLKMTWNPEDAFDLTHDAYILAFDRLDQFNGKGSAVAWLTRIAVNEALQFFRRSKMERSHLSLVAVEDVDPINQDESDVRMDLESGLAQLEPSDRTILILRHYQGLNYREISEVMECPMGTIASRLSRSREKLRQFLQKNGGSTEGMDSPVHQTIRKPPGA